MAVPPERHDSAGIAKQGFTLVEMSIVLIIMSVVVGSGFALATRMNERQKEDVTLARLDAIEKALLDYRKANDHLPCPADGTVNPDNANYGIEAASPSPDLCTGGTPAANFTAATHATKTVYTDTTVVGGTVPIVTLGLPKEYGIDGWGNKFSYHIDARATERSAFSTYTISNGNCFNIIVDDLLTWADDADRNYLSFHAVYALISHGKDGHGAFSMGGPRINSGTVNAFQQQNADYDDTGTTMAYNNLFHHVPASEDPDTPRDRFDDILRFKTRAQLRTVQDGPGIIFPDLILSSSYSTGAQYGTRFMYRCGDDFLAEASEMVDINNKRVKRVAVSPNNTYILGAMESDYHFRMWTYDGVKTTMLPDNTFSPFVSIASGTTENVAWSKDGEFFLVSAMDDGADLPNRVSIYERTGVNQFTRVDEAVENATNSDGNLVLNSGALWGLNLRPDGNELIIMYGVVDSILPMLFKRNPDNSFSHIEDAIPDMPDKMVRRPVWSDDSNYLAILEETANAVHLFRNEGNNTYSSIPALSPMPATAAKHAAFSPDSRFLVLANETNNEVRFYELNERDEYVALAITPTATPRATYSLQFSRDGKYLAVGKYRDAVNTENLYIYKIEGNVFTLLNDDPDIRIESPNGTIIYAEWRQLMPWEKE